MKPSPQVLVQNPVTRPVLERAKPLRSGPATGPVPERAEALRSTPATGGDNGVHSSTPLGGDDFLALAWSMTFRLGNYVVRRLYNNEVVDM